MNSSAKGVKSQSTADAAVEKYTSKSKTTSSVKKEDSQSTSKFANIKSNPFHQITLQSDLSPEAKSEAVAKALSYDSTKSREENEEQIAAFEEFKDYLMERRKDMSKEIIRLSDTEAFSELQAVLQEMNTGLLNFEKDITPLIEIIDAIHRLNIESDGAMYDVFKEVEEDKAEEERIAALREEQEAQLTNYTDTIANLNQDIAALSKEKAFFGLGGVKQSALKEIARKEVMIKDMQQNISELRVKIENTVPNRTSNFAHLANEKAKLRELLDLTSDEHKERQKALIQSATNFVQTTEEKTGSVLEHMRGMKDQINNIDNVNSQMKRVFAVVTEGIKGAEASNAKLTEEFKEPIDGETSLQKLAREDNLEFVNRHVDTLNSSKVNTLATFGELQEESMNIKSMRDTNAQQITKTQQMHSSGTAGVASRLTMVLSAVSAAALNESSTSAENTLAKMNQITRGIAQNEAIQNASNIHVQNDKMMEAIEQLKSYKEISDKATQIARAGIEEQKQRQRELEQTASELAASVKKAKGITAEVMQNSDGLDVDVESTSETETEASTGRFEL